MSQPTAAETAYAKINLALHVRRRRPDGYHEIETLFAFCEDGDRLIAAPADDLSLAIEGPFGEGLDAGPDNLVLRAAAALRAEAGVAHGAALRLDKHLPVAAGVGGGSADAAAALRLLARLWSVKVPRERIHAIACSLGADVPACVESVPCRGEARGDALTPIEAGGLSAMPVLLVNPRVPIATGPVFAGWDGIDRGPLARGEPLAVAVGGRNDLEGPAFALAPVISELVDRLAALPGVRLARMSGSGATCFALFESEAARDEADRRFAAERPGWWRMATRLR